MAETGQQLTPGMYVQPSVMGFGGGIAHPPDGSDPLFALRFETVVGSFSFFIGAEPLKSMRDLIDANLAQMGALSTPPPPSIIVPGQ